MLSFYRIKRTFRKGDTIRTENQAKSELRKVKGRASASTPKSIPYLWEKSVIIGSIHKLSFMNILRNLSTGNTTGKLQNTVKDKASKAKGNTKTLQKRAGRNFDYLQDRQEAVKEEE